MLGTLPWHVGAVLVEAEADDRTNIWRRWEFMGRMEDPHVSFTGDLIAKRPGYCGDYRHDRDSAMVLDFRELDLREAHHVGLFP